MVGISFEAVLFSFFTSKIKKEGTKPLLTPLPSNQKGMYYLTTPILSYLITPTNFALDCFTLSPAFAQAVSDFKATILTEPLY